MDVRILIVDDEPEIAEGLEVMLTSRSAEYRVVARARDGRAESTCLTEAVYHALGTQSIGEIVTWLYAPGTGKKEVAALAPLLRLALDTGDPAALLIADKAGRELALIALAVFRRLGLSEGQLALTGSILNRYEEIRRQVTALCSEACPGIRVIDPLGSPAQGAARMARERFGE